MKNADYWRGRFSILEDTTFKQSEQSIQAIEQMYMRAQQSVKKEIEAWYGRFAVNNQISLSDARKMLTTGQLEEFRWTVDQYIQAGKQAGVNPAWLKQLENASARVHVSRLEALQLQIQQQVEILNGNQLDSIDSLLKEVVGGNYTHTAYEIQKGLGLGWDVTALNQRKLETLISKPWTTDGRTFRDRCWTNKTELVNTVNKQMVQGIMRGDSPEKTIQAIQKQFGISRYKARRLVHTETSYFNAQATKEAYKDLGIEKIEILETLDSRTCEICGGLDGTVIPLSQYEPGVTVPPFHPNCRGTTCPYYDDMDGERAARDANGEVYYVPDDMTFDEWKAEQDRFHGAGTVDLKRKMNYNYATDKAQFERYRGMFKGSDFPKGLDAFQQMKYTDIERWENYKAIARTKNHLQQKLSYVWNGEKSFIPQYAKFSNVVTIAGAGTEKAIRDIERLVDTYHIPAEEWKKRAGKVTSDKYIFDLHWYEADDGLQREVKLKNRTERKR